MVPALQGVADKIPFWGCINLLERDDRYEMMKQEFESLGLHDRIHWHRPHRHPAGGRVGCFESHLEVYKAALKAGAPYAVVCEDDVKFSSNAAESFETLVQLTESGVPWTYVSLQNSGGEVILARPGDEKLPLRVARGVSYFTRCYAITAAAMERAVASGITPAHIDVALAVANWGRGFILRPAAVTDVPSESDNDWSEGGWPQYIAGRMQGFTHAPCVVADRWKTVIQPRLWSHEVLEDCAWRKFMAEPGAKEHVPESMKEVASRNGSKESMKLSQACFAWAFFLPTL